MRRWALTVVALAGVAGAAGMVAAPALAGPGDVYSVSGEKVNLRAAPGDGAAVRSAVTRGEELVELRREGNWLGVRVLRSGEEGWVFSDLVKRRVASTLGTAGGTATGGTEAAQAGFARISPGFDGLLANIGEQLGYRFAEKVEQGQNGSLRVVPTSEWTYNTSLDAKMYAALALYQMWKNYNNGRSVSVALGSAGSAALTVEDSANGPQLGLPVMGSSR